MKALTEGKKQNHVHNPSLLGKETIELLMEVFRLWCNKDTSGITSGIAYLGLLDYQSQVQHPRKFRQASRTL
jgi:hypothetical protein